MSLLTRDQILQAADLRTETVKVKEWSGEVRIAVMTGAQRDAWEQSLIGEKPGKPNIENARARLLAYCIVDEKGAPLFKAEDITQLGRKSGVALERCSRIAQKLNALTDRDLEDAAKNSDAAPSDSSTSISP